MNKHRFILVTSLIPLLYFGFSVFAHELFLRLFDLSGFGIGPSFIFSAALVSWCLSLLGLIELFDELSLKRVMLGFLTAGIPLLLSMHVIHLWLPSFGGRTAAGAFLFLMVGYPLGNIVNLIQLRLWPPAPRTST